MTDLLIPELAQAVPEPGERPVRVRIGVTPSHLEAPLLRGPGCEADRQAFLLSIPGTATYYASRGEEVVIQPAPDGSDVDTRSYLLGSLFSVLCHQRGLLPLHASAVAADKGAIAFLGASGAGKSSLAAFLSQRGYRIVADDICLIDPEAPQTARVRPVAPWIKLWDATLEALGQPAEGLPRVFIDEEKFRVTLQEDPTPLGLAAVVLLEQTTDTTVPTLERLRPVEAMQAMLDFTYQEWLVRGTGQTQDYFLRCGRALQGASVYRLRRPWGFASMDATVALIRQELS